MPTAKMFPVGTGMNHELVIPFSLLLGMVAITATFLWHLHRLPPPGYCQKCGYNLTGNVSGICPECGEPTADRCSSDAE